MEFYQPFQIDEIGKIMLRLVVLVFIALFLQISLR